MNLAFAKLRRLDDREVFFIIAALVFVEALVLLVVLGMGAAPFIVDDERVYHQLAINMLERGTLSYATSPPYEPSYWRTPGFPAFIAAVYAVAGYKSYAVRALQFVCLAVACFGLFKFASAFVSRRAALVGALVCATYPPLVFMAPLYGSELAAFPFLMAAMVLALHLRRSETSAPLAFLLLGLIVGILTMIRPTFGLIIPPLAFLAASRASFRRWFFQMSCAAIGFLLIAVPWIVRNSMRVGHLTGAGPSGWELYVSGQQWNGEISCRLLKPEFDVILSEFSRRNDAAEDALRNRPIAPGVSRLMLRELMVSQSYARDTPALLRKMRLKDFPRRTVERIYWLWSTCDTSPWSTALFHRFVQAWHVLVFGSVIAGIFIARRSLRAHALIWLVPAYVTALHFIFHVESRYTLLARPFVFIYAGIVADCVWTWLRARSVADSRVLSATTQ